MYSEKVKGKRNANSAKKLQYWRMKTSELKFQKKEKMTRRNSDRL